MSQTVLKIKGKHLKMESEKTTWDGSQ
ncbi:hypothetical protein L8106_04956 [Lyngbya sp. PCC 8106]|nr:hypothetical protein L8106_04956 [Lyngbya sp. PCC 8106]